MHKQNNDIIKDITKKPLLVAKEVKAFATFVLLFSN